MQDQIRHLQFDRFQPQLLLMKPPPPPEPKNLLLRSLSAQAFEQIGHKLTHVQQHTQTLIADAGKPFEYVYFPDEGMISMVLETTDGASVEVGTVGSEGFVGIPVLLGSEISDRRLFAQIGGYGWSISLDDFNEALEQVDGLRSLCQLFTLTMLNQASQIAACNSLHTIDERCARWLLVVNDREPGKSINLTQKYLSMMLGVRRSGVNVAIKALEQAGLIEHTRGCISIVDRAGLEKASCDCYRAVRHYFNKTMKSNRNLRQ